MFVPPALVLEADRVRVPYGVGLRRRVDLESGQIGEVTIEDYGAGKVLHVGWPGGHAYLPLAWFPDEDTFWRAHENLRARVG